MILGDVNSVAKAVFGTILQQMIGYALQEHTYLTRQGTDTRFSDLRGDRGPVSPAGS